MKYKPKRLLVIAGPSGCGKSWFIDNIIKANNSTKEVKLLKRKIEAGKAVTGNHIKLTKLENSSLKISDIKSCLKNGGFLHFDYLSTSQKLRRQILGDFVKAAERVIVLNISVSFERWIEVQSERSLDLGSDISPLARDLYVLHKKDPALAEKCFRLAEKKWIRYMSGLNINKYCTHVAMSHKIIVSTISRSYLQDLLESIEGVYIACRLRSRLFFWIFNYL